MPPRDGTRILFQEKPSEGGKFGQAGFVTAVAGLLQEPASTPRDMMIASAIWRMGRRMFMLICCIFR